MTSIDTLQILNDTIQIAIDSLSQKVEIINFPQKAKPEWYESPWFPNVISSFSLLATIILFFWNKWDNKKTELGRRKYEDERDQERKRYEDKRDQERKRYEDKRNQERKRYEDERDQERKRYEDERQQESYKFEEYRRRKEENFEQKLLDQKKKEYKNNWIREKVYQLWIGGVGDALNILKNQNEYIKYDLDRLFIMDIDRGTNSNIKKRSDNRIISSELNNLKEISKLLSLEENLEKLSIELTNLQFMSTTNFHTEVSKNDLINEFEKNYRNINYRISLYEKTIYHYVKVT